MNNNYIEPNIDYIKEYFSKTDFGIVKPSEIELLMFYILSYHKGDLNKSIWELARDYSITEQKATRYKIEIGKRFSIRNTQDDMSQLAKDIFVDNKILLDFDNSKIGVPVNNPCYLRSLKETLSFHNLPFDMGNNGNLIKLSTWVFLAVFAKSGYSSVIKKNIKTSIKNQLAEQDEFDNLFKSSIPLSATLKKFLIDNAFEILGVIPVVGSLLKLTVKASTKIINK